MATWWRRLIPKKNDRELRRLSAPLGAISSLASVYREMDDATLAAQTGVLKERFAAAMAAQQAEQPSPTLTSSAAPPAAASGGPIGSVARKAARKSEQERVDRTLQGILPEAFAVCREASRRVLGLYHYDTQIVGGLVLHEGKIAEMKTGEGKTLVATLPAYLNALTGRGVHVVTVNEYLASRDAAWMGRLYHFLGLRCGLVVHGLTDAQRQQAYTADITYGTNSEFGFDYLRDNMKLFLRDYSQRGHAFAIVDEVDSILIDEARTPLIISGPSEQSTDKYMAIGQVVTCLRRDQDYVVDEKARTVVLTESGVHNVEQRLKIDNLYEPTHIDFLHHVNQGLRAQTLYRRDVDYMVEDGKVKIIDEFTGRVLDGRRWSDGLHQAIEAKEAVRIENENQTLATITYQNYFRQYQKLSGMTGTAETEAEEFAQIYDLDVVCVPTNRPMVRDDLDDVMFRSERGKLEAVVEDIAERQQKGQPVLVGTISVEKSEILSRMLRSKNVPHNVLNAKYHRQEAEIIAQAGQKGAVTIATNMAGRGTDILLGGNPDFLARAKLSRSKAEADDLGASELAYKQELAACEVFCAEQKEEVKSLGGLHILGTERHESRRIDNQLRGRAGRQGDPGSSRFYISLEDDLLRLFGGDMLIRVMERFGLKEGEVIEHPSLNNALAKAQRQVEGQNFDMRKHLLEYDDVMNDQRTAVYTSRRTVLGASSDAMREMIKDLAEDSIISMVEQACPERTEADHWDITGLSQQVEEQLALPMPSAELSDKTRPELEELLYDRVEKELQGREERFSTEPYFQVARILYLQTLDVMWRDHLREMDQLREGISLRGYAQKDPKQEYKKEGFNLFGSTMAAVGVGVLQKVLRVVITHESEQAYQDRQATLQAEQQRTLAERHDAPPAQMAPRPAAPAGLPPGAAGRSRPMPAAPPPPQRRDGPKTGANEACPCGSGKKFKKCHGAPIG